MDAHVAQAQSLFSAARDSFKHLEYFYFHNCLYEGVWRENARRWGDQLQTHDILRTYGSDYKCLFWAMPACPPMRFRTAAVPLSIGTKNQAKFGFSVPGHNGQQVSG